MTLTRPLDHDLASAALAAQARYEQWVDLAHFWRRAGARNTARACLRYADDERALFDELLYAAEAGSLACPRCGRIQTNSEADCIECGQPFHYERDVAVTYSTTKAAS